MTIHFVYVKGSSIGTPHAITNEISNRLASRYKLQIYDWEDSSIIKPKQGDILLGHPHPRRNTIFRNSFFQKGWSKRIILSPFAHAMPKYISFLDPLVIEADRYLAICGEYWIDTIESSLVKHWIKKITRIDLGVSQENFPFIKDTFNDSGNRGFLYVGRLGTNKGTDLLAEVARRNQNLRFGWIGGDSFPNAPVIAHGAHDFRSDESKKILRDYDFIVHFGRSDANPTTILEGLSWGLIPACTKESGYYNKPWLVPLSSESIEHASNSLHQLNYATDEDIRTLQFEGRHALAHYTWDAMYNKIEFAINDTSSPIDPSILNAALAAREELKKLAIEFEAELPRITLRSRLRKWISSIHSI